MLPKSIDRRSRVSIVAVGVLSRGEGEKETGLSSAAAADYPLNLPERCLRAVGRQRYNGE